MPRDSTLTGVERFFDEDEIIVSKTDLKGHITYANDVFLRLAGMTEQQALGAPHSCIRHPDMPRCVFKLLWDTVQQGDEIFAYVVNRAMNGDHYWVLAHVTPSYNTNGGANEIVGYHSNRRVPDRRIVDDTIVPLYRDLCAIEHKHANRKDGLDASFQAVLDLLQEKGVGYDEFILTL